MNQNSYHNPWQKPCPYTGRPGMYGMPNMYLDLYEDQRRLMNMYPDCYQKLYPLVQEMCQHMDVPTNPRMYPYVEPAMLDEMINQIYIMEMGEASSQQRGFLRDLIAILFIRELLGRRRRHYGYQYGYDGGFQGVGYPGY